jgi:predicted permease
MSLWTNRRKKLQDEIQNHIDLETQENIEAGMPAEEARRAALKKFGGVLLATENSRDVWGWLRLERLLQDVGFSLRMLAKAPTFTLVAVLTLALGIGANAAIFSLINAVLLKHLPVTDPATLVRIGDNNDCCVGQSNPNTGDFSFFPTAAWKLLKDNAPEFEDLAAMQAGFEYRPIVVRRDGNSVVPRSVMGEFVSGNYFHTFGLRPQAGDFFNEADDRPEAAIRVVMSYDTWQREFAGDASAVGSTLWVNTKPVTVAGIAPDGFYGDRLSGAPPEFYLPIESMPQLANSPYVDDPQTQWLYLIGRIKPGVSLPPLQEKLSTLFRQYILETRPSYTGQRKDLLPKVHVRLTPGGSGIQHMSEAYGSSLSLLMFASALVLLIACANIANLLLARGMSRKMELSLRTAVGAGRGRLVRQLLTESLVLALVSGAAGLLVAYGGTQMILALAFPRATNLPIGAAPSPALLAFAFAASVLTGVLFGTIPAFINARVDPADALRSGARTVRGASVLQRGLVVLQAALSLVLLAGAGLFLLSLGNLQNADMKVDTRNRYILHFNPQAAGYPQSQVETLYHTIEDRFHALPGIVKVGISSYTPMEDNNNSFGVQVQGQPDLHLGASYIKANADYFVSVGTHILMGRGIAPTDTSASPVVAVVNQSFVKRLFKADENPIGRHFGGPGTDSPGDYEIVGVAEDTMYSNVRWTSHPMYFAPLGQRPPSTKQPIDKDENMYAPAIVLQTVQPMNDLQVVTRKTLASINPNLSVIDFRPFDEQIFNMFSRERMVARLTTIFGALALLVTVVGLYGVTAYVVARRTSEIGIRIALGARRTTIIGMILRDAAIQMALGLAIGIPAAFLLSWYIQTLLYEIKGLDVGVLALAILALIGSSFLAALVPACRAASIAPSIALRSE